MSITRTIKTEDARSAAAVLRALVATVDAGEVEAGSSERAYLVGALDALAAVSSALPTCEEQGKRRR